MAEGEIQQISQEQFVDAVSVMRNSQPSQEEVDSAKEIIELWNKQETSIGICLEMIAQSDDSILRFFAVKCIQYWIQKKFKFFPKEICPQIIELLSNQIRENSTLIDRNDFKACLIVLVDLVCIFPSYFEIIETFDLPTQIQFLGIIFEENSQSYIVCESREIKNILQTQEVNDQIIGIISSTPINEAWYKIAANAESFYRNDAFIAAFLSRSEEILAGPYFPGIISFLDEALGYNDQTEDEAAIALMNFALQCCDSSFENVADYAFSILSTIFMFSDMFFSNNPEFTPAFIVQTFPIFATFAQKTDDFYYALSTLSCLLAKELIYSNVEVYGPIIFELLNVLIDIFDENNDLVYCKAEEILTTLQFNNEESMKVNLLQFYEERISNLTFGVIYTAAFVQDWMPDSNDLLNRFVQAIVGLSDIPYVALTFISKTSRHIVTSEEMAQQCLSIALTFFESMPLESSRFISTFCNINESYCAPFLEEIFSNISDYVPELDLSIKKYLYMAIFTLSNHYGNEVEEMLSAIAEDYIDSTLSSAEGSRADLLEALNNFAYFIGSALRSTPNEFMKKFFDSFANEIFAKFTPLFQEEDDGIQSQCCKILHNICISKWVESPDAILPYLFESMSHCLTPAHFQLLGDIFPCGFMTATNEGETPIVISIITSMDLCGDVNLNSSIVNYLTKIVTVQNTSDVDFLSIFGPDFVMSLINFNHPQPLLSTLQLYSSLINSPKTPPDFSIQIIRVIIESMNTHLSNNTDLQNKACDVIFSNSKYYQGIFELLTGLFGESEYIAQIGAEMQNKYVNKNKLRNIFRKFIQSLQTSE